MRIPHLLAVTIAVAICSPGWSQAQSRTFARGDRGYQRDLRRMAKIPKIPKDKLEKALFSGNTSFTRSLLPKKGGAPWRSWSEGYKDFSVDLGNGCTIKGRSHTFRNPINDSRHTNLRDLSLLRGKKSISLMPLLKTHVSLDFTTGYWYDKNSTTWQGPESKYAVLALLHEMGHAKDYSKMSEAQRKELKTIYDRKSFDQKLTKDQKRKMVGFERSAWAHALKQARQLKRQGFDILAGSSHKEVMGTIYTSLRGYYEYKGTRDEPPRAFKGWPGR